MPAPHDTSLFGTIALIALVAWRLWARVRRMIGRQRLRPFRTWATIVAMPLLFLVLATFAWRQPGAATGLAAGAAIGLALGVLGLRRTRFETTPAGLFYTPDAHLGIALSALLVGRLVWRAMQVQALGLAGESAGEHLGRSPLTLALFGTLAGYYLAYAVGLVRWRARVALEADAVADARGIDAPGRAGEGSAASGRDPSGPHRP